MIWIITIKCMYLFKLIINHVRMCDAFYMRKKREREIKTREISSNAIQLHVSVNCIGLAIGP